MKAVMATPLTAEQQRMIEENRRKALERRAQRLAQNAIGPTDRSTTSAPKRFIPPLGQEASLTGNHKDATFANANGVSSSTMVRTTSLVLINMRFP